MPSGFYGERLIAVPDRFWGRVDVRADGECWEWQWGRHQKGYGLFRVPGGVTEKAHRLAWILAGAVDVPSRMSVLHTCDNPPCCNPAHLFIGTNVDNVRDRTAKHRHHNSRKTHCKRGHLLSGANLMVNVNGERVCRVCARARTRTWMRQRAQEARLT